MYDTSIELRDSSCLCREIVRSQSDGRTSHPSSTSGAKLFTSTFFPKLLFDSAPQKSPPEGRKSCAAGLERSQSGAWLPFASLQLRVTPAVPFGCVVCGMRSDGLLLA